MPTLLLGAAVALLCGASSGPSVSGNGVYSVEFSVEGSGEERRCQLAVAGAHPLWKLERCVGGVHDLYFVSNDGQRVWVLFSLGERPPDASGSRRGRKRAPAWTQSKVAALYGKSGEVLRELRLAELVSPEGRGRVRLLERHFLWLQGTGQLSGRSPRALPEGELELETVEPKTIRLGFGISE